jgi:hypothetical protein
VAVASGIAEIGMIMDQYPSVQHLANWASLCPENHESAGKRLLATSHDGNAWMRRSLCQAAWVPSPTKATYLAARFRRLAVRQGKKRALVTVCHTILAGVYHVFKAKHPYGQLRADSVDRIKVDRLTRYFLMGLEQLRVQVTVHNHEHVPTPPTSTVTFAGEPVSSHNGVKTNSALQVGESNQAVDG